MTDESVAGAATGSVTAMKNAVDRLDYVRRGLRQEADRPEPEPRFSRTLFASARRAAAAAAVASTLIVGVANIEDAALTVENVASAAIDFVNAQAEPSSDEHTSLPGNGSIPALEELQRSGLLFGLSVNDNNQSSADARLDTSQSDSFVSREWLVATGIQLPESPPVAIEIGRSMVEATRVDIEATLNSSTHEKSWPIRVNFYVVPEAKFPFGSEVNAVIGLDALRAHNFHLDLGVRSTE